MKRAIAFDVGSHTIGVAKSDLLQTIAQPVKTFRVQEAQWVQAFDEIFQTVLISEVDVIVVGWPKNLDDSESQSTQRSERFAKKITKYLTKLNQSIEVIFIDERLTTKQAENVLISANVSRKKRKQVIDTMAAVLILEMFLKQKE